MDWKKNRLAIASSVLVVATVGAVLASRSRDAGSTAPEAAPVTLPTFDAAEADGLRIERPDDDDLQFVRVDGVWRMQAPVEAAADASAVEQALEKLAALEVKDTVSTNPALHARLEVVEGKALRATATKGEKPLIDLWIGPRKDTGTLVRQQGEDAVVSIDAALRYPFTKGTHMYRDRVITDLDASKVQALRVQAGDAQYAFVRTLPDGAWEQAKGEKPIAEFDPARVQSLVSSLAALRAAGFDAPGTTPAAAGLDTPQALVTLELAPEAEGGEPRQVELRLGKLHEDDGAFSLRRADSAVPYRVSKATGERMIPDAESFVKQATPAQPQFPSNPHPAPGQPQLPPEVLQQLQQQLGQR